MIHGASTENEAVVVSDVPENVRTSCFEDAGIASSVNDSSKINRFNRFFLSIARMLRALRGSGLLEYDRRQHSPFNWLIQERTNCTPSECTTLRPSSGIAIAGSVCSMRKIVMDSSGLPGYRS